MTTKNCWLQDIRVQNQLEQYFADVDKEFSEYYDLNRDVAEPQLDAHLASRLEKTRERLELYLNQIDIIRKKAHLSPLKLSFKVSHITSQEYEHGADIGLVANIILPGEYTLTKAVLVQTKRLYPDMKGEFSEKCVYPELFKKRKTPQWTRMLTHTSASVYFFYNPYQLYIKRGSKILGTRVMTAQHISGLDNTGTNSLSALDMQERGKEFSSWFVEDFICCQVGDVNQEVIEMAMGKNPRYPVRFSILTSIESDKVERTLWQQEHLMQ